MKAKSSVVRRAPEARIMSRSAGAQNQQNSVDRSPLVRDRWTTFAPVGTRLVNRSQMRDPLHSANVLLLIGRHTAIGIRSIVRFTRWSKLGVWDAAFETLASLGPSADKEHAMEAHEVKGYDALLHDIKS